MVVLSEDNRNLRDELQPSVNSYGTLNEVVQLDGVDHIQHNASVLFEFLAKLHAKRAVSVPDDCCQIYEMLKRFLTSLPKIERLRCLTSKDRFGASVLHAVFSKDKACSEAGLLYSPSADQLKVLKLLLENTRKTKLALETDRYGENILHKVIQIQSIDSIKIIIDTVSELEVVEMLCTRNTGDMSPLDYMFLPSTKNRFRNEVLRYILDSLCNANVLNVLFYAGSDQKCAIDQLFLMCDTTALMTVLFSVNVAHLEYPISNKMRQDPEPLHEFICFGSCIGLASDVENILENLLQEDAETLLQQENRDGDSLMHCIMKYPVPSIAYVALEAVDYDRRQFLLLNRNSMDETPLHRLFSSESILCDCNLCVVESPKRCDTLMKCLDLIPPSKRVSTLVPIDTTGETVFHKAVRVGLTYMAIRLLEPVNQVTRVKLLQMKTQTNQETVIMHAVEDTGMLFYLLALIPEGRELDILGVKARDGNTVLHFAVMVGLNQTKCILQSVDNHGERVALANIKNSNGQTVLDIAKYCPDPDVETYLRDEIRDRNALVIVSDDVCKDNNKGLFNDDEYEDSLRRDETRWNHFHPVLGSLLFGSYHKKVAVRRVKEGEIIAVFHQPIASLKSRYRKESERILSYEDGNFRSAHMTASALARVGLIYKGNHDEVMCLWCQVEFGCFKAPVDAQALHMAHSENVCSFLMSPEVENEPIFIQTANVPADSVLTIG